MAYSTLVAGTTITAAWANASVRDQTVSPFASAAARSSAVTSPVEGMVTHLNDSNTLGVYSGAAWSTIGPVHGAWSTYTPAVVQLGSVTVTVNRASHIRLGRMLQVDGFVSVTGSGTAANLITISLPASAASTNANTILGQGYIYDSSSTLYSQGAWVPNSATTAKLHIYGAAPYAGVAGFTAALASSDLISFQWNYELASDA